MSNAYDLGQNYRAVPAAPFVNGASVTVIADSDGPDLDFDPATGSVQVPIDGGNVEVSFGPKPVERKDVDFFDNLAEHLDEAQLSIIAERLLKGIEQDDQSRAQWLQNMTRGISLLGLEIKSPAGAATTGASPAEGTSNVDHPLLLEAVLRFQANARGELLPSDGPVKVRNDGEGNSLSDALAEALEKDMNHYLTKVAKEYYPDTDRMLLMLGFSGISFKKGYHCPIKRRPVIASIDANDLIVSNAATDIDGAGRVTHRILMRPSVLRRMQLLKAYRDIHLPSTGMPLSKDAVETKIDQVQGIAPPSYVEPDDQERELYECYCEIEVPGFEHEIEGEQTGLPLPYKVTLDKEARRILEIRRNWEDDDPACLPRNRIIAYTFIPGLGFYGIGLLNVLGNATKAVTAAWRLMIDAGMFSNFPGFLYLKSLAKQLTNQFRVAPGTGMPIDTVGADIRASIMPLPYKDPSAVFIQLIDNVVSTAQRVGGTAELQIGEGKQDAPVGTTLAMIEQATKLMSAVHKRLHQAQGAEFDMLKSMLMEDPESLWRHNKRSKVLAFLNAQVGQQAIVDAEEQAEDRHRALFLAALNDVELVPAADPNTSSQTERYLKVVAMRQMAASNPNLDLNAIDERALRTIGIDDPQSLFKQPDPNAPPPPPSPEQITAQATIMAAQARIQEAQTRAKEAALKAAQTAQDGKTEAQIKQAELASKERIAALGITKESIIHAHDMQDAERQRQFEANQRATDRAHEMHQTMFDGHHRAQDRAHKFALASIANRQSSDEAANDRRHELATGGIANYHKHLQGALDRRHDLMQSELDRQHQLKMKPKPGGVARP